MMRFHCNILFDIRQNLTLFGMTNFMIIFGLNIIQYCGYYKILHLYISLGAQILLLVCF
jgi:hypothetical protein